MTMKFTPPVTALFAAAAIAFAGPAFAQSGNSASDQAPGQRMQDRGSFQDTPGASGYAPGQRMQERGEKGDAPGASGYAPGQNRGTTGSGGMSNGSTRPDSGTRQNDRR